jgi:RND family efflux transporter MFP subunit
VRRRCHQHCLRYRYDARDRGRLLPPGRRSRSKVSLPDDASADYSGELTFIDNGVDRATGTITARATVPNPKFTLLPGQYVRVRLHVRDEPDALLVPQIVLGSSQLGKYVYVVGPDSKAEQKIVTLGPTEGDSVSVTGLAENDRVITGNLQKIGPGSPVLRRRRLLRRTRNEEPACNLSFDAARLEAVVEAFA